MLKRVACALFALIISSCLWTANKTPVFSKFASEYELYLFSPSSTATVVYADKKDYPTYNGVTGESCVVYGGVSVEEVINSFGAKLLFVERTDTVVNYYCYSNRIKYEKLLNGFTVNLQISVSDTQTKLGAPMIFGSF